MNTSAALAAEVDYLREQMRDFKITTRKDIKKALIMRFGSLTEAAWSLHIPYQRLSATLANREQIFYVIDALKAEFGLSNEQVVEFWPLVKEWPKKSRIY